MNKVHILTFHRALNYGAVLQCCALYKAISEIAECDVIDYRAPIIENRYKIKNPGKGVKVALRSVFMLRRNKIKRRKFSTFLKDNIRLTEIFENKKDLCKYHWSENDIYCTGSDQVWNWEITGEDDTYLLSFAPKEAKKFSYAASIGLDIDSEHLDVLCQKTSDFVGISVREKSALNSLKNFGINSVQNIDPVFLLSKDQWIGISKKIKVENSPYVLIYLLQSDNEMLRCAEAVAKKRNLKIVFISTGLKKELDAEYIVDCGPDEFLSYFLNASVIFTNSFHGIAFSVIFEKEFYFNYQGNSVKTNSRLENIIETFDLSSRNITDVKQANKKIDYDKTEIIIKREREEALSYLTNCIDG